MDSTVSPGVIARMCGHDDLERACAMMARHGIAPINTRYLPDGRVYYEENCPLWYRKDVQAVIIKEMRPTPKDG